MTKSPIGTLEVMGDQENRLQGRRVLLPNPAAAAAEALGVQLGTSHGSLRFLDRSQLNAVTFSQTVATALCLLV